MKKNNILAELLSGILFLGILIQVICIFVAQNDLYNAIGLWVGIAIACFMAVHIKYSLEDAIEMGEDGAVKHARNAYVVRTIVAMIAIVIVVLFKLGNPITLVIGIFPLKLSAYLQPHIHKLFVWFGDKRKIEKIRKEE